MGDYRPSARLSGVVPGVLRALTRKLPPGAKERLRLIRAAATGAPIASTSSASPLRSFRTFYDAPAAVEFVDRYRAGHRNEAEQSYFKTHAGRFAFILQCVNNLGLDGECLDVGGTPQTRSLLEEETGLRKVLLSPPVDLEIDAWSEDVGHDRFDLVVFSEVIEHLNANPAYTLHQINRCLQPGGWLILTTVNVASELGLYNLSLGEAPYAMANIFGTRGDRHQREYALLELQRLVAAHGFKAWATTRNLYSRAPIKDTAHVWFESSPYSAARHLHGDTNIVIAKKVEDSKAPRWLHPVYHDSVSENRRGVVPPDVAARLHAGLPPGLRASRQVPTEPGD